MAWFDEKIKKLNQNYLPKNAALSQKIISLLDPTKLNSKAHIYKQKKFLKDLQHRLLIDMRTEIVERIKYQKELKSLKFNKE
jgi:hypothetical protein